jgi:glutamine amidotransferase-like uncharacterized protein
MLIPFGVLSAAGAGVGVAGDYELIATEILTTSEASITFSNLGDYSATYKHLQIRFAARTTRALTIDVVALQFNADTGSNYSLHRLTGNGSTVASAGNASQGNFFVGLIAGANAGASQFGASVVDILDPYSTTKNTTARALTGSTTGPELNLYSGAYYSTNAVSEIKLFPAALDNFVTGSRFSLYGIK